MDSAMRVIKMIEDKQRKKYGGLTEEELLLFRDAVKLNKGASTMHAVISAELNAAAKYALSGDYESVNIYIARAQFFINHR